MTAADGEAAGQGAYRWEVLGVVMIATLMAGLDSSIVNIALPDMMADFGTTIDRIEWVVTGYMLGYAVFITMAPWFKDRLGGRRVFLAALVVFTVGSGLCGLAWNLPSLIAARVAQSMGGGFITSLAMSMVAQVFPPSERGRAIGIWAMGVILGPAVGPTIGGYLTQHVGWRSIFMVNLPIGLLTLVLGSALLRPDHAAEGDRAPFDGWGFLFLSLFLVSLLLGVSQGERLGWRSAPILACWATSVLGFVLFLAVEAAQTRGGIVDLSLFRSKVFTACILVTVGRPIGLFGATFLLPLFMQNLMGRDELQSGLLLLPGSLLLVFCMPLAGRMADRVGPRWLVLPGALGLGFFLYAYRGLDAGSSDWALVWPQLVRAAAIALMVAPVMASALNSAPTHKSAQVSSMLSLTQQVFGSVGIAVLASFMDHRRTSHFSAIAAAMDRDPDSLGRAMAPVARRAFELGHGRGGSMRIATEVLVRQVGRAAEVRAFDDTFVFAAAVVTAACVLPALLLPTGTVARARAGDRPPPVAHPDGA